MTFDDLLRLTRRRWWLVLAVAVLGGLAGYMVESAKPETYEATGRVVIGPALDVEGSIIESTGSLTRGTLPQTLAEVVTGSEVRRAAEQGLDAPTGDDYDVDAVVVPETSVVEVDVMGPDRALTMTLASALLEETETVFEGLYPIFDVVLLDEPDAPESPVAPDPVFGAAIGAIVGTALGLVLAAWSTRRRDLLDEEEDQRAVVPPAEPERGAPAPASVSAEPTTPAHRADHREGPEDPEDPEDREALDAAPQPRAADPEAAVEPAAVEPEPAVEAEPEDPELSVDRQPTWAPLGRSTDAEHGSAPHPGDGDEPFEVVDDPTSEPSSLRTGRDSGPRFDAR